MKRATLVLALVLGLLPAHTAAAATRDELSGFADRAAAVWADRQAPDGRFLDPRTSRPVDGYGNAMLGYALLRAGERRDDPRLVASGVRAIATTLGEAPEARGVFDLLALATAYTFVRERLPDEPALASWEAYLRETPAPNVDNAVEACIVAPDCFHNHEAVGAAAALALLGTELESTEPGARLADRDALRAEAVREVEALPAFAQGDATWTGGEDTDDDLALLSDTGNWPLAYHALSSAMLAHAVALLGDDAPDAAEDALRRTAAALAAFMAPDGTVAYVGKRQESVWSLTGAIATAQVAAARGDDAAAAALYRAVADRALARLRARYPLTSRGLPIVPRAGADAFAPDGVDGDPMTFNGLALFLLNLAADAAPDERQTAGALRADADGAFLDRAQNGFAAVRRGDVWFAVHGRDRPRDVRNDVGLMAAKWRAPNGGWVDVVRPRPMRFDDAETAGPVIERGGERLVVAGGDIAAGADGSVEVQGTPTTLVFSPTERGVRLALPAQAGDVVTYTAYLAEDATVAEGGLVRDRDTVVTATPAPESVELDPGFASCCDVRMVAARIRVPVAEDGTVTFGFAARPGVRPPAPIRAAAAPADDDEGGPRWWVAAVAIVALIAAALTLRRRAVVRRGDRSRRAARLARR